ncbi:hypothetical protein [Corynebacterium sp. CCM 9203]|uniref:hypothetical protein n=1 Tax=Corynebacterium sp. CCM 9203 TaxID=3057615 RepID=UPI003523A3E6
MKKLVSVLLCSFVTAACTISTGDGESATDNSPSATRESNVASGWVSSVPSETGVDDPELRRLAEEVASAADSDGQVGVVFADGRYVVESGEITGGPAWSTIKVPVSMAVLYHGTETLSTVERAITQSDNAAFDALWHSLGDGVEAAKATEEVLRSGGDDTTILPDVTREGFSAAGQTDWSLLQQARFAQQMTCIPGAGAVLTAMNQVIDTQSYGLGTIPALPFKGGWGPDRDGDYLVRQFGILQTADGFVGIALAVRPEDGTYGTGRHILDRMAERIATGIENGVFDGAKACAIEHLPEQNREGTR